MIWELSFHLLTQSIYLQINPWSTVLDHRRYVASLKPVKLALPTSWLCLLLLVAYPVFRQASLCFLHSHWLVLFCSISLERQTTHLVCCQCTQFSQLSCCDWCQLTRCSQALVWFSLWLGTQFRWQATVCSRVAALARTSLATWGSPWTWRCAIYRRIAACVLDCILCSPSLWHQCTLHHKTLFRLDLKTSARFLIFCATRPDTVSN